MFMSEVDLERSSLFTQTVTVFLEFAPRILTLAKLAEQHSLLHSRLTKNTFSAGEHLAIAQGFALRTVFPVIGKTCPKLSTENSDYNALLTRHRELVDCLNGIPATDFDASASRQVSHIAGEAALNQNTTDYVQLFGLPNFYFHMTMAYATLRAAGIDVGKAQFDGLHEYSPGFSFQP